MDNNPVNWRDPEGLTTDVMPYPWTIPIPWWIQPVLMLPFLITGDSACTNNGCQELYAKIDSRVNELKKRYSDLTANKLNLPPTGPMSIEGHRQQFRNKQVNLRNLLNEANAKGCTGYRSDAWHWATVNAP